MDALMVLLHWLYLLALALWVGGLVIVRRVLPGGRRVHPGDVALLESARHRAQTVIRWSVIALVVTLAAEIVARIAVDYRPVGFAAWRDAFRAELFGSRYGIASVGRWILAIGALWAIDESVRRPISASEPLTRTSRHALGIVAGGAARGLPRFRISQDRLLHTFIALTAALLVATVLAGPYGGAPLTALADLLHLGGAMVWFGGTIMLALAVTPFLTLAERERRPMALLMLLDRFAPYVMLSVIALAATGLWETMQPYVVSTTALWLRTLTLVIMVTVSGWGALLLRPRLRRLAMRARRDPSAALRTQPTLALLQRQMLINPLLAVVALGLGCLGTVYPGHAATQPLHQSTPRAARHTTPAKPRARHGATAAQIADTWQPLGPRKIAYSVVADPANHAHIYLGTYAGVYRSLDGGAHWSAASAGLANTGHAVYSLTVIPDGSLVAATSNGVYRSTDGATTWRYAGLHDHTIYTFAAHMAGHVVLLAGVDGGVTDDHGGIYRSDDLAATWRRIYDTGDKGIAVVSLAWPSIRPELVVAGLNLPKDYVVISHDGGSTWKTAAIGLPIGPGIMSVAVAPGAQNIYAGTMGLGAYISRGITGLWEGRNTGLPGLKLQDAHIGSFAFDPANPSIMYAGTPNGVYRSRDAGLLWTSFGMGLRGDAAIVETLALVTGAHPLLYATTADGLYRLSLPMPAKHIRHA